jgi:hypothetical protein
MRRVPRCRCDSVVQKKPKDKVSDKKNSGIYKFISNGCEQLLTGKQNSIHF